MAVFPDLKSFRCFQTTVVRRKFSWGLVVLLCARVSQSKQNDDGRVVVLNSTNYLKICWKSDRKKNWKLGSKTAKKQTNVTPGSDWILILIWAELLVKKKTCLYFLDEMSLESRCYVAGSPVLSKNKRWISDQNKNPNKLACYI